MTEPTLFDPSGAAPKRTVPQTARDWVHASRPTALTANELDVLADARAAGYLTASGRRVALYVAWQRLCREAGRPCITIRVFKTYATVAIDSVEVWRGKPAEVQHQAAKIAVSNPPRYGPREDGLWSTTTLDRALPGGRHDTGAYRSLGAQNPRPSRHRTKNADVPKCTYSWKRDQ